MRSSRETIRSSWGSMPNPPSASSPLSPEQHCDADTWGIRLLELVDQGFAPEANVADFGAGLRAGHKEALSEVPCRGDIFHALHAIGPLVGYLEKWADEAIDARTKLECK